MFKTKEKREAVQNIDNAYEVFLAFAQAIREIAKETTDESFWAKIAIDGLAAVGKGTLTKLLQKEFGVEVISNGHFYRALTWMYLSFEKQFDQTTTVEEKIAKLVEGLEVHIQGSLIYVNHPFLNRPPGISGLSNTEGVELEENNIRTSDINSSIAEIAQYKVSQDFVDDQQLLWMDQVTSGVLEGRQGYSVFNELAKEGKVKLVYMFASEEELNLREIRREASKLGRELTPEEEEAVIQRLRERNIKDLSREHNPPLSPEQARESGYYSFLLDTTNMDEHQVAILFLLELFSDNEAVQAAFFNTINN